MEAMCQTELSPELCLQLAENMLIIKKIVGRAQKPLMSKTLLRCQVVRKTRKETCKEALG